MPRAKKRYRRSRERTWTPEQREAQRLAIKRWWAEKRLAKPGQNDDSVAEAEVSSNPVFANQPGQYSKEMGVAPRPLTWNSLPRDARKCAKRPGIPDSTPVVQMRCINCRLPMWTRDPKVEDICETCEFVLIDEKHKMRRQHEGARGGVLVNPFAEQPQRTPVVNSLFGSNTRVI